MDRFIFKSEGDTTFAVSENLGVKHGFSTRHGGVSRLAHTASMNLAYGRGDDDDTVKENMRIFCKAIGVDSNSVVSARQIHSAKVLRVCPEDAGLESLEADGFVTDKPGITLCVKTADCVPILFADSKAAVIGAVHAGWRGTAAGIACVATDMMCRLGAERERIQVAIGPCIHPCCYEVGDDFIAAVAKLCGEDFANEHIYSKGGRTVADLVAMNRSLLISSGIPLENISASGRCTCCEPELFFSHRATGGIRGTMAALISL